MGLCWCGSTQSEGDVMVTPRDHAGSGVIILANIVLFFKKYRELGSFFYFSVGIVLAWVEKEK